MLGVAVLQGLGGGPIVLKAAHLALMSDSSPETTRSLHFSLALVASSATSMIAPFSGIHLLAAEKFWVLFLVSQICWVVYLGFLTFVLREDRVDSASTSCQNIYAVGSLKVTVNPLKLFFGEQRHGLLWAGAALWTVPMSGDFISLYVMRFFFNTSPGHVQVSAASTVHHLPQVELDSQGIYLVSAWGIASAISLLFILPISTALYRRRYGDRLVVGDPTTTPTERTPLLRDETQPQETDVVPTPPLTTTTSPKLLSVSQDLSVVRASFIMFTIGVLIMSFASNVPLLLIGV